MLTFDFDGVSGMLNRDPEVIDRPTALSIGEFGPRVGVFRILDLLDKYGIPATFFVPGYVAERNEDTVREIARRGHEVGHHGYMHEPPASLSLQEEADVLDRGSQILEGLTGQRPLGYRSPSWELSKYSLALMAQRGFLYDSSLMGDDAPYFVETDDGRLVELPIQWALDDVPYYTFTRGAGAMASPHEVYNAWQWEFDAAYQYGRAFHLTMHPYVTGRLAKILVLERLIGHIRSHAHTEFMRCMDVAKLWSDSEAKRPSG